MNKVDILRDLDFGNVDSESEVNLDQKFIKTDDFDEFLNNKNVLTIGSKGSGKSALFEMFTKYEKHTRDLCNNRLNDIFIIRGTGFKDVKELSTSDIEQLMIQEGFDFLKVWNLYIAIKCAFKLGEEGYCSGNNLNDFLKNAGRIGDYRILPVIKYLWGTIVGEPPKSINLKIKDVEIKIGNSKKEIDVDELLIEINDLLEQEGKTVWILFDKVDEIFSNKTEIRKKALEGLFLSQLYLSPKYSRIKMKILLRTDIWKTLNFVNKSHLIGKILELKWDKNKLMELIVLRGCSSGKIKEYLTSEFHQDVENYISEKRFEEIFYKIFDDQVYKGNKQAPLFDWVIERITDGMGNIYPRELITFGNSAVGIQRGELIVNEERLISGNSIKKAYYSVSKAKCDTYLTEFPKLERHYKALKTLEKAKVDRGILVELFKDLEPKGEEAIKELYEVGILKPKGDANTSKTFEIPRLFRHGLGLVLRGRP